MESLQSFWTMAQNNPRLLLVSAGMGLFVAFCFFKAFFEDWSDFWEGVKLWLWYNRGVDSKWAGIRLFFWAAISVSTAALAFYQLPDRFPHLFHQIK